MTLKLLGIEYHTQTIHYTGQHFYTNPFRVAKEIGDYYESTEHGSRQPTLNRHDEKYSISNKYGNELPDFTTNHYEFGLAEDNVYNRFLDVSDSQGGTVETGGVQDYYDLGFDTPSVNAIDIALFSSGARSIDGNDPINDSSLVTITNTDSINLSEQEGGILNPTGTVVLAWGSPIHGSLPLDMSKYRAGELEFTFRPEWKTGVDYLIDSKVFYNGKHYKATSDHISSSSNDPEDGGSPWSQIDMAGEFGNTVQYSPWTDDKAALWANSGSAPDQTLGVSSWITSTSYTTGDLVDADDGSPAWITSTIYAVGNEVVHNNITYRCTIPNLSGTFATDLADGKWKKVSFVAIQKHTSGTFTTDLSNSKWEKVDNAKNGNGAGFYDSNRVIKDQGFLRTWVNEIIGDTDYDTVNDAAGVTQYNYDNSEWPLGHRLLNFSDTSLSGNDLYGKPFKNSVVERIADTNTGTTTQWKVIYTPDSTTDRMQVVCFQEGKTYEWNDSVEQWQDVSNEEMGNDCLHQYKSIYNIRGVDPRPDEGDSAKYPEVTKGGFQFSKNIRSAVEVCYEFPSIVSNPVSAEGYKKWAGINFSFPFPINTFNSISEGVGDLYGGGTNESVPPQPSFLDIQNMTYTPTGLRGFNQADSEQLGPLSSISFMMRASLQDVLGNTLGGTLVIRCTICDHKDNLVTQDFELKFSDGLGWESFSLPFTAFGDYRAREPKSLALRGLSIFGFELPINELDIQNVFEWRNIKNISFQIQDFYDDDARYSTENNIVDFSNTGFATIGGGTIRFAIDGFHFKKVLLASSGSNSVRNMQPIFLQRPNIISFNQLRNDTKSQLEIEKFKHKEYNIQTSGDSLFDIRFGDTFFLQNQDIISDTDDSSNPSDKKIKLVAKRIEYHITKPVAGPGGVTRSIKGVKRFI